MESKLIIRSKKLVCDGLVKELKSKKNIDDISIKGISDTSGVSTRTIYRHFSSIDDILYHTLKYMIADYRESAKKPEVLNLKEELISLCSFFNRNKEFFQLLHKNKKFGSFRKALQELGALGTFIFNPEDKANSYQNIYYSKYFKRFIVSILSDLMEVWVINDFKETPEELAFIALYFINSVSKAT